SAAHDEQLAARGERDRLELAALALVAEAFPTGVHVQNAYFEIRVEILPLQKGKPLAVGAERERPNLAELPFERGAFFAPGKVPDLDLFRAGACQFLIMRAESQSANHVFHDERVALLALSHVPDLNLGIMAS